MCVHNEMQCIYTAMVMRFAIYKSNRVILYIAHCDRVIYNTGARRDDISVAQ